MSRRTVYLPHNLLLFAILFVILLLVVGLLFLGAISIAFLDVGFSPVITAVILFATLLGGFINIPVLKLKTTIPVLKEEFVEFFGMVYRIPHVEYGERTTMLAVNVGGALIPTAVSLYLLWKQPQAIWSSLAGVAIVAIVTHLVSRPVKGVGITTIAFISPIAAVISAYLIPSATPRITAYVAGVLGTLIGADLSNLHVIPKLGAPIASIGGAGTFDGIFLSGIIAVLLA